MKFVFISEIANVEEETVLTDTSLYNIIRNHNTIITIYILN